MRRPPRFPRAHALLAGLLLICVLVPTGRPPPAGAQFFPDEEPPHEQVTFGCAPGPVQPFDHADPPVPPHIERDESGPSHLATLSVATAVEGRPIQGSGFNIEHTLWSCRSFRRLFSNWILEPFEPDIIRVDSGQLPFAPEYLDAAQLDWSVYQAMMDDPKYQPSWDMLRRLNRANVQILLGVWGAPGAFTDDGTRRGQLLAEHVDDYIEYATAIVDYLVNRQGIRIWAITVMNEPDGGDGTYIDPDDFVRLARGLGPPLARYGVQLYGPDTASAANALPYVERLLNDRDALAYFGAIATHEYFAEHALGDLVEMLQGTRVSLPVYVTEFTSFTFGAMDRGQEASDEVGHMLDSLRTYVSLMNAGADAALYWDAVDYYQAGHAAVTRWGLLQGPEDGFAPRKRYYGFQQILPFAQRGARVLRTSLYGSSTAAALALSSSGSRSGELLIAVVNPGGPLDLHVYLDAVAPTSLDVYVTDRDRNSERTGRVVTHGRRAEVFVPASSITTLTTGPAPLDE